MSSLNGIGGERVNTNTDNNNSVGIMSSERLNNNNNHCGDCSTV